MLRKLTQLYIDSYSGLPRKVWYLSLVLLINRSGAMVLPFLTVYLVSQHGYEPVQAGYAMLAFGIGGVFGNNIGGYLNDRFGSWHVQWIAMIVSGLFFISLAFVTDLLMICILIFFTAMTADCFRPANKAAVAYYTKPESLTQAFGLQRMAVNLGLALGPLFAALILEYANYQWLFWGDGITCIIAAVAFLLLIPADRTARPLVDKKLSAQQLNILDSPAPIKASIPALRANWLMLFCLSNLLIMLAFFLFIGVLPVQMVEVGYREMDYSRMLLFNGLLIVFFEMILLHLLKGKAAHLQIMKLGAFLIILGNAVLWAGGLQLPILYLFIFLITFGEIFYMPFTHTYVTARAPLDRRGEYLGMISASYAIAFSLVAPLWFKLEVLVGWDQTVLISCLAATLGWLGIWTLSRREREAPVGLVVVKNAS
ncbi:MAG: MFS transporter [Bacteroidota bacterium]